MSGVRSESERFLQVRLEHLPQPDDPPAATFFNHLVKHHQQQFAKLDFTSNLFSAKWEYKIHRVLEFKTPIYTKLSRHLFNATKVLLVNSSTVTLSFSLSLSLSLKAPWNSTRVETIAHSSPPACFAVPIHGQIISNMSRDTQFRWHEFSLA